MGFLSSISIFSQTQFWRLQGQSSLKTNWGGVMTLLLLLILGSIFSIRVAEVYRMETVRASQQQIISTVNSFNLSTGWDKQNQLPLMVAIKTSTSAYKISAIAFQPNEPQGYIDIELERCTYYHFKSLADASPTDFLPFTKELYWCLPLNQTYILNTQFMEQSYIQVTASCKNSQNKCTSFYAVEFLVVSHVPNPTDPSNKWIPKLYRYNYAKQGVDLGIQSNILHQQTNTEKSLFPILSQKEKQIGPDMANFEEYWRVGNQNNTRYTLRIEASETKVIYTRSFLTYLDAISYTGGLISPLLLLFYFMKIYGTIVLEMCIARFYYRRAQTEHFGFFSFLKQKIYKLLCCKPNWKFAKEREKIHDSVNRLIDVVNLQKRIDFLERAVYISLNQHHLKGIRLQSTTMNQDQERFQQYNMRDKIVQYFMTKQRSKESERRKTILKKQNIENEEKKKNNVNNTSYNNVEQERGMEGEKISSLDQVLIRKDEGGEDQESEDQMSWKEEDFPVDPIKLNAEEEAMLREEIEYELENDLKQLLVEAERGDQKSQKIVDNIDPALLSRIKKGINKSKKFMFKPDYELNKTE